MRVAASFQQCIRPDATGMMSTLLPRGLPCIRPAGTLRRHSPLPQSIHSRSKIHRKFSDSCITDHYSHLHGVVTSGRDLPHGKSWRGEYPDTLRGTVHCLV
jgi:hypothetical protein